MIHQNLILTEQSIGRHTKRLQKELSKFKQDLRLSEAQNMLSRVLGMKDYHELKKIFKFENYEEEQPEKGLDVESSIVKNLTSTIHVKKI